jgi:hypothetical protein
MVVLFLGKNLKKFANIAPEQRSPCRSTVLSLLNAHEGLPPPSKPPHQPHPSTQNRGQKLYDSPPPSYPHCLLYAVSELLHLGVRI